MNISLTGFSEETFVLLVCALLLGPFILLAISKLWICKYIYLLVAAISPVLLCYALMKKVQDGYDVPIYTATSLMLSAAHTVVGISLISISSSQQLKTRSLKLSTVLAGAPLLYILYLMIAKLAEDNF